MAEDPNCEVLDNRSKLNMALVHARLELTGIIYKGGQNTAQRYNYVGHEQVLMVVRSILLKHGLLFLPTHVKYVAKLDHGEKSPVLLWEGMFELTHIESGEMRVFTCMASTILNDKGAFVASTSLERVALLRLMALAGSSDEEASPYVEDPESDHSQGEQEQKQEANERLTAALAALAKCQDQADMVTWFRKADKTQFNDIEQQKLNVNFMGRCKTLNVNHTAIVKEARAK